MGLNAPMFFQDYPVFNPGNFIFQWYFNENDKKIFQRKLSERNNSFWGIEENDSIETAYVLETSVEIAIKRLELRNITLEVCEKDFRHSISKIRVFLERFDPNNGYEEVRKLKLFFEKEHSFKDWLNAIKFIIENKIPTHSHWDRTYPDHGSDIVNYLVHSTMFLDKFHFFELMIPCDEFDIYARIILECCNKESLVILDATEVVHDGSDEDRVFNYKAHIGKDSTKFFDSFQKSITEINDVINSITEQQLSGVIPKLLYANVITTLETYLSDVIIFYIINFKSLMRKFVETDNGFINSKKKFSINEIFNIQDTIEDDVANFIQQITFHNLDKTCGLYKNVLMIDFTEEVKSIRSAIAMRHDIVHRNGKDIKGTQHVIGVEEINNIISETTRIIKIIDKELREIHPDTYNSMTEN